jgi:hypothetical protein
LNGTSFPFIHILPISFIGERKNSANLKNYFLFQFFKIWKLHIRQMTNSSMEWILGFSAIVLLVIGLVGQAFEMRKIRLTTYKDEELASANIFMNKKNFKWYALLGIGIILWYVAERM